MRVRNMSHGRKEVILKVRCRRVGSFRGSTWVQACDEGGRIWQRELQRYGGEMIRRGLRTPPIDSGQFAVNCLPLLGTSGTMSV